LAGLLVVLLIYGAYGVIFGGGPKEPAPAPVTPADARQAGAPKKEIETSVPKPSLQAPASKGQVLTLQNMLQEAETSTSSTIQGARGEVSSPSGEVPLYMLEYKERLLQGRPLNAAEVKEFFLKRRRALAERRGRLEEFLQRQALRQERLGARKERQKALRARRQARLKRLRERQEWLRRRREALEQGEEPPPPPPAED